MVTLRLYTNDDRADPSCDICRGTGVVTDWVDYGDARVPMESICVCALANEIEFDESQEEPNDNEPPT